MRVVSDLIICLTLFSVFHCGAAINPIHEKEWTLIFIVNGRNHLVEQAISDLQRIAKVGSSEEVNIIVHFTKSKKSKGNFNWIGTKTFYVKPNDDYRVSDAINSCPSTKVGNNSAINDLVSDIKKRYRAKKYLVVFWDHANVLNRPPVVPDPLIEINSDSFINAKYAYFKEFISLDSIKFNFEKFKNELPFTHSLSQYTPIFSYDDGLFFKAEDLSQLSNRFSEIILFDACLLANLELATALAEKTNIMIASQELVNATISHHYEKVIKIISERPHMSPEQVSKQILKLYRKTSPKGTLSIVSPENAMLFNSDFNDFCLSLINALDGDANLVDELKVVRNKCRTLGATLRDNKTIDMIDFFKKIKWNISKKKLKASANNVLNSIRNNRVIINYYVPIYSSHLNGLSIYYPKGVVDGNYEKVTSSKNWDLLLKKIQDLN